MSKQQILVRRGASVQDLDESCPECGNGPDDIARGERCCPEGNVAGRLSRKPQKHRARPSEFQEY